MQVLAMEDLVTQVLAIQILVIHVLAILFSSKQTKVAIKLISEYNV